MPAIDRTVICSPDALIKTTQILASVVPIRQFHGQLKSRTRLNINIGFEASNAECYFLAATPSDSGNDIDEKAKTIEANAYSLCGDKNSSALVKQTEEEYEYQDIFEREKSDRVLLHLERPIYVRFTS